MQSEVCGIADTETGGVKLNSRCVSDLVVGPGDGDCDHLWEQNAWNQILLDS